MGGIVIGKLLAVPPVVFRLEWPQDIQRSIVTMDNPMGSITNSDLECAGLLLLWLVIEATVPYLCHKRITLYSDNSPSISWIQWLASRRSIIAMQLIRALALRMQLQQTSPLTTLHIPGKTNHMTDIPSRSFGSNPIWHCKTDLAFVTMYTALFALPSQDSWNVFRFSSAISMRVISILLMKVFVMDEWRRLPGLVSHIGSTGPSLSHLWGWTLTYRTPSMTTGSEPSRGMPQPSDQVTMDGDARSQLLRSVLRSQPLAR